MSTNTSIEQDSERDEREAFERSLIAELDSTADQDDHAPLGEQQADTAPVVGEREQQQAPVQQPAPTQAAPAPQAAPATQAQTTPAKQQPENGDLRPALRAARHEVRALAKEFQRVKDELTALKSGNSPPPSSAPRDIEGYIASVEADFPDQGAVLRTLHTQLNELRAAAPQPQAEEVFVPERLADAWQDLIDEVPELLSWQTSKEHAQRWDMAKAADALLSKHPAWQGKPVIDRLNEAVRRVNAELAPDPRQQAAAAIQNAPTRTPETLSSLRGGIAPSNQEPDYAQMTDEQIFASLH